MQEMKIYMLKIMFIKFLFRGFIYLSIIKIRRIYKKTYITQVIRKKK